ncbi:MAG: bifunctional DNA primase/polymerase [Clostridia bacterium]
MPKGRNISNKSKFAPGFDTRSTGGLIVVSPSIHVSGNQYQWLEGHSLFDRTPAEAPKLLLKLMERMSEDEVKEEAGESNKLPNQHFFHYSEHTRPYEEVCFLLFFQ